MFAKVFIFHLYDFSFRTLGSNPFPCDCSISLLWKDYKGMAQLFPNRDIIGFHRNSVPVWFKYAEMMKKRIPNLTCLSNTGKVKVWNQIDLSMCVDKFTVIAPTTTTPRIPTTTTTTTSIPTTTTTTTSIPTTTTTKIPTTTTTKIPTTTTTKIPTTTTKIPTTTTTKIPTTTTTKIPTTTTKIPTTTTTSNPTTTTTSIPTTTTTKIPTTTTKIPTTTTTSNPTTTTTSIPTTTTTKIPTTTTTSIPTDENGKGTSTKSTIKRIENSRYLDCDFEDVSEQFSVGVGGSSSMSSIGILCGSRAIEEFPRFKDDKDVDGSSVGSNWLDSVYKL